jgi:Flp pilus assembly protein TadG
MRAKPHRRWRRQRGQSAAEMTMMLLVIFMVVFWIFELAWVMYTYSVLADAANEGVRYAVVHSGGDVAGTQATVKAFAATSLHNISAMPNPSVTFPDGNATPPNRLRVTVTYTYIPYIPSAIVAPIMHAYAEGRMVTP